MLLLILFGRGLHPPATPGPQAFRELLYARFNTIPESFSLHVWAKGIQRRTKSVETNQLIIPPRRWTSRLFIFHVFGLQQSLQLSHTLKPTAKINGRVAWPQVQ